jgi:hypothetical protein
MGYGHEITEINDRKTQPDIHDFTETLHIVDIVEEMTTRSEMHGMGENR